VYDQWSNILTNPERVEKLAGLYDSAVSTNNYRRPTINRTGKRQSHVQSLVADPSSVYDSPEAFKMLEVLSGTTQKALPS
jgi:hypothetical protein